MFCVQAWREIDVRITRYHVEACDNAKFLGAIEKSSHAIYLEVKLYKFSKHRKNIKVNSPNSMGKTANFRQYKAEEQFVIV